MALQFLNYEAVQNVNRSEFYIEFINGSQLWFKSADNPDALRGRGIDFLILDEAALIKRDAWEQALRPSLSDTKGRVVFIGTPKGYNWFHEVWTRGNDPLQKDWKSWQYPTSQNPYIPKEEIEEARRTLPEIVFQQEYEAIFTENLGAVFRGVETCIRGSLAAPQSTESYVMGADLAKHQDFTVLSVMDSNGHLCAFDRFSQLDWVFQRKRIVNLAQQYNARVLIDSTGVGDPVLDELCHENVRVEGYKFTNATKKDLIENLSMMIENKQISYPDIPELVNELKIYGYRIMPSGTTEYSAPEGYHDDCVIALALAAWLQRTTGPLDLSFGRTKL